MLFLGGLGFRVYGTWDPNLESYPCSGQEDVDRGLSDCSAAVLQKAGLAKRPRSSTISGPRLRI